MSAAAPGPDSRSRDADPEVVEIRRDELQRLITAEQRFRLMAENSSDVVSLTSKEGTLIWISPSAVAILGWKPEDVVGSPTVDYVHPDDRTFRAEQIPSLLAGEQVQSEMRLRHGDGTYRWFHVVARAIFDDNGDMIGRVSGSRDIHTEVMHRQEQGRTTVELAELNEQLQRSNEDLRRFAYVASHDLQGPLRTVGGFTEVLLSSLNTDEFTDRQKMMVGHINAGIGRMHELIRDLLTYARVDTTPTEPEPVFVSSIVDDVTASLAADIESHNATVTVSGDDVEVLVDLVQLRQVVQNLIANAITHAHPERDPVIAITSEIDQNPALAAITVADNGVGIEAKHHARVFELFKQLQKGEGTGIGLAIVQRTVERHGGTITVDSDGVSGTSFRFTVPRAAAR